MLTEEDFAKFTAFRVRAMGQRLREMCEDRRGRWSRSHHSKRASSDAVASDAYE